MWILDKGVGSGGFYDGGLLDVVVVGEVGEVEPGVESGPVGEVDDDLEGDPVVGPAGIGDLGTVVPGDLGGVVGVHPVHEPDDPVAAQAVQEVGVEHDVLVVLLERQVVLPGGVGVIDDRVGV